MITPGHLSLNPRLVKEANCLAEAGFHVQVISARYNQWGIQADHSCCNPSWSQWTALSFGPLAPKAVQLRQKIVLQVSRWLWRVGFQHPLIAAAAWHPVTLDLIRETRSQKADLYIAHYPAALPAAALAARRHGAQYGFDAEDFHLGDPPEGPQYNLQRALTRAIEGTWLPGARHRTAASSGIAAAYASSYGFDPPAVILNVFPLAQAPPRPTDQGEHQPGPTLYWFSQTVGPDRGLECAVEAIGKARSEPHLHLRGNVSEAYRNQLEQLAEQMGVSSRLHFHPPALPHAMETIAASFDVGLVGETGLTANRRIALTNKLFSYALAGVPMVLSDIPAHRDLEEVAGDAVRLFRSGDSRSLASALDSLLAAGPTVLPRARRAAYQLGQSRWNWDSEKRRLVALVSQATGAVERSIESRHKSSCERWQL